jgi:3'-phosphoadenosine 5'-phosphosulfate sulfotransferase (PAPS reductase)/FAD synthetase
MRLIDNQLQEGLFFSKLPQFINKENKTLNNILLMQEKSIKNYVACSWGKQSIIVSHMVFKIDNSVPIVFFDGEDSELIADFKNISKQFCDRFKINYICIHNSERHLKTSAKQFTQNGEYTGFYMGLSKCESKGRRYALNKARNDIFLYKNGIYRCCPLADWSIQDCAAYIAKYDLPLLKMYKKYGLYSRTSAGVTPGTHAECGIDWLSSESQDEIRERWKERHKNGIK